MSMRFHGRALAFLALAAISGCDRENGEPEAARVRYETPDRTYFYEFADGIGTSGPIEPAAPTPSQSREFSEVLGQNLYDCSTPDISCVRSAFQVFAAPRARLTSASQFAVAGVSVKVEECLRESEGQCQVALMSADCQSTVGIEDCEPSGSSSQRSSFRGPVTYYIYNVDYGVTAFGSGADVAPTVEARQAVAHRFVLTSELGLLQAKVTTKPTKSAHP